MRIHQISTNSNFSKLQTVNPDQSVCNDWQLSEEQADKAAIDAMLEMLGISREYYSQVSKFDKLP